MKDNKLIAEFMGWKRGTNEETNTNQFFLAQPDNWYLKDESELQFHSSWDWLMPVVDKCTQIGFRDTDTDDNPLYELWDRLFCDNMGQFVGNHIDEVYNSVVEFIKEQNK